MTNSRRPLLSPNRRESGFTLVELLVAIGLMVVIVSMMATIMITAQNIYDRSSRRAIMYSNARVALDIIRDDFSHIVPLATAREPYELELRSRPFNPKKLQDEWELYAQPSPATKPVSSDAEYQNKTLMTFYSTIRYFDERLEQNVQRVARVIYYMRFRPPDPELGNFAGAFLIRRVEPYHYEGPTVIDDPPIEDDVCSFVRGVRIWYLERDRDPELEVSNSRFIECTNTRGDGGPTPKPFPEGPWDTKAMWGNNGCKWKIQDQWQTDPEPFATHHFLPPAIMLELLVTDEKGEGNRSFRRIFNLDLARIDVPDKR